MTPNGNEQLEAFPELPAPVATQTPERAAFIRSTLLGLTGRVVDRMLVELTDPAPGSGSPSPTERLMLAAIKPMLPGLRTALLSRLSAGDPALMERIAGAIAVGIQDVLAAAPGEPLPVLRPTWAPDGSIVLVPVDGRA